MVGRRLELEQLRTVLSACKVDGRGRTAYVRGEAGIGKTRLLEALLAAAREQGFACHTGLVLDFGTGSAAMQSERWRAICWDCRPTPVRTWCARPCSKRS